MSQEAPPKRRGRPSLPPDEKKRRNVTFRLRDSFREEIERRAAANGRSMSEEIETILERFVPLADIITKRFVEDVRSLMEKHKSDLEQRNAVAEIARWNVEVISRVSSNIKLVSEDLARKQHLYSKIDHILAKVGVNDADRLAINGELAQELSISIDILKHISNLPAIPIE